MSVFKSEKVIPISVANLAPVAEELMGHFQQRNYDVNGTEVTDGAWEVGITRGGVFKAAVGLKTALKIQIEARPKGTLVRAGVGIFGRRAAPTAITLLVAWPVVLGQVWGLIRQAGLDDEAIRVVEVTLTRMSRLGGSTGGIGHDGHSGIGGVAAPTSSVPNVPAAAAGGSAAASVEKSPGELAGLSPSGGGFCISCGRLLEPDARFCAHCGQARTA